MSDGARARPASAGKASPSAGAVPGGQPAGAAAGAAAPPPKRADAQRNYRALISAAATAFAERGADDVSLEEIARRAGVGIGTLYRHFPSRYALVEAVYTDQVDALEALAGKLLVAESPGAALGEWLRAFAAFGRAKRSLHTALVADLGKNSELLSACSKVLRDCTEAILTRARQAGAVRPEVQSADLLRLAHGLIIAADDSGADPGQADRMLSLLLGGLLAGQAG